METIVDDARSKVLNPIEAEGLSHLFSSAPDPVFLLDWEGKLIWCNPAGRRMVGGPGKFITRVNNALLPELLRPRETSLQGVDVLHGERHFSCSAWTVKAASGPLVMILAKDVSHQASRFKELVKSEGRYRAVVDNLPTGIFVLRDGVLRFVNEEFCRIFRRRRHEVLYTRFENLLRREDRERFHRVARQVLQSGKAVRRLEFTGVDAEGRTIALGMTLMSFHFNEGRRLLGQVADITRRKQLQRELLESNRRLKQALYELKQMQSRMVQQEKMASIGQLAAGIAHEMNNPLGFVLSNFTTLREYMEDFGRLVRAYRSFVKRVTSEGTYSNQDLEAIRRLEEEMDLDFIIEDLEDLFKETKDGLERLKEIIQSLRNFSRVDQVGDWVAYDINEGIRTTLVITKNEYKYHAEVELQPGEVPLIHCHPGQINEVLMNLIVNAAQAIKGQQRQGKGKITIKTFADDHYVYCSISDDGPGIPRHLQSKIFEPFFTTKEVGKGTGLGLSICYDVIVHKHGGEITVESEPGKGATFTIKLPIDAKARDGKEGNDPLRG